MLYPIPYILLYVLLGVMAVLIHQRKDDEVYCHDMTLAGMGLCIFFFGLRGFVFHDWMNYYPEFEKISFYYLQHYDMADSKEPGWLIFQLLCKGLFDNYHFMVFVHSVICMLLLYRFLRQYVGNVLIGMMVYLVFDGYTISINLLRNSMAIMIFLNALPYLYNRRPLEYTGLCLLAACFHFSALTFLPMYFFLHRRLNKWAFAAIYLTGLAIYLLNVPIFQPLIKFLGIGGDFLYEKIEAYTELSIRLKISIGLLERLLTGFLIFCYYEKLLDERKENVMFINTFVIYILAVFLLSEFSEISKRISMIFVYCYWILWVYLIRCFHFANNRRLFVAFISIYGVLRISAPIINQPVCEYDNLLLGGIKSYQERRYIFERTFDDDN